MTKIVTIIITGETEAACSATARRVVNTADNVAAWVNTNQKGNISSIRSATRDVVSTETKNEYVRDAQGNLTLKA